MCNNSLNINLEQDTKICNLLDLSKTIASDLFEGITYPWEALPLIKDFILKLGPTLDSEQFDQRADDIWIAKSAKIFDSAYLHGPLIIDENAEVRQCAFIRGSAIVGKSAVIGNSVELKNCVIFDGAQVPHFNYCGDSVLGYKSHIGAGGITSNLKSDKTLVSVKSTNGQKIDTGIKKFGAILGNNVEVGCNSVLNPGSVIGQNTNVYPTSCVRGFIPANCIFKNQGNIVAKH